MAVPSIYVNFPPRRIQVMTIEGHYDSLNRQQIDDAPYGEVTDLQKLQHTDRRWNRRVGVGVGLLCIALALLNVAVPLYLYQSNMVDRQQLQSSFDELQDNHKNLTEQNDQLQTSFDQLQTRHNQLTEEKGQLQKSFDQLQTRHNQLTEKTDNMNRMLCGDGWQSFGRSLYYISTEKKNWADSRRWCRDRQSDLIVIKTKEEQDFVKRVQKPVWLGLTDIEQEGRFKWVDGTSLTTPTEVEGQSCEIVTHSRATIPGLWYWGSGQPDNYGHWWGTNEENCVEFYEGSSRPRGWNDLPCAYPINWICERALSLC